MSRSTYTGSGSGGQSTIEIAAPRVRSRIGTRWRGRRSTARDRSVRTTRATRPASIREKSSSVLTSFSRRSALRWTVSRSAPCSTPPGVVASASSVGPEQQRQRRAELVADVAEERRLRAIDGRKRLGALSFLFVGAGVGERGAELIGDQVEERRGTDRRSGTPRIDADDEPCRARPDVDERSSTCATRSGSASAAAVRCACGVRALQARRPDTTSAKAISCGLRGQRFNREHAGFALGPCAVALRAARSRSSAQATLADDALGRLRDDAEHAADGAGFNADGIVRDVEVGLLRKSVPFELKQQIARPECFAGSDDVGKQPVQLAVPDLAPRLASRTAERVRMLDAEARAGRRRCRGR